MLCERTTRIDVGLASSFEMETMFWCERKAVPYNRRGVTEPKSMYEMETMFWRHVEEMVIYS